ncbi:triphosphoribosyl-dephospho-CoA synthase [Methylomagnum sp.]
MVSVERREAALAAYLAACELELQAFKPGNVSVHSEGHDMTVEDFRRSAAASAPFLCDETLSLGEKIFYAVDATWAAVGCNTNLGIVLLSAPLIRAFESRTAGETLREALAKVLAHTTVADADWVYRAIRRAQPGGLGAAPEQDIREEPQVTLLEAMRLAEHRDRIAFQYTNSYADILNSAIPRYHAALSQWDDEVWATVMVFVGLLASFPDSHVERKFGAQYSRMIARRMAEIEETLSGAETPQRAMRLLQDVDSEFKAYGINPGTTADLTVACLLVAKLRAIRD